MTDRDWWRIGIAIIVVWFFLSHMIRARNKKKTSILTNAEAKLSDALVSECNMHRLQADVAAQGIVAALKIDGVVLVSTIREMSEAFPPSDKNKVVFQSHIVTLDEKN